MPSSVFLPVTLILGCALLGGYASVYTSHRDGFFDALKVCTTARAKTQCILDVAQPYQARFKTGLPRLDGVLAVLFEFFNQGLTTADGESVDLNGWLAVAYLAAQFGGAWYLIALEGLRRGNANSLLSWTGSFGIVLQLVTITIMAPIYLTLHLLSAQPADPDAIAIDTLDLALIPVATMVAYILPTIGLALSLANVLSSTGKYFAIALWQPFPLYQTAVHKILRFLFQGGQRRTAQISRSAYKAALGRAYGFALFLTMGTHLLVVGAILVSWWTSLLPSLSPSLILSPGSLSNSPTLVLSDPPVSITSARDIVVSFLRWDVYCASAALVIWASYLAQRASRDVKPIERLLTVLFWVVVGGPVTPAIIQLWQRDLMVSVNASIPLADAKTGRKRRSAFRSLDH